MNQIIIEFVLRIYIYRMDSIEKWTNNTNYMLNKNKKFLKEFVGNFIKLRIKTNVLLREFENVYPYAKVYPNSQKYQTRYQNVNSELEQISTDTFLLDNEISKKLIDINKIIEKVKKQLENEKKLNQQLKNKEDNLEEGVLSSDQLFQDEKTTYQTNIVNIIIYAIAYLYIGKSIYKLIKK